MTIVFIEEVGGPVRVCSKQATADLLGVESADVDLTTYTHPAHYTLVSGVMTLIQAEHDAYDVAEEREWISAELLYADIQIAYLDDGDTRQSPPPSDWREYRKALRNRVQAGVIVGPSRPVRPGGA